MMNRISWVPCLVLAALPAGLAAQSGSVPDPRWTLTLQAGIHADRFDHPERMEAGSQSGDAGAEAFTAKGEAPTLGLRATRWLGARLGIDGGLALAHNASWSGSLPDHATAPRKLTLFSSVGPVWRFLPAKSRWQLQAGAGPALIFHTGSGQSLLTRSTDFGAVAMADGSVRLSRRLRLAVGAQNYRFTSRFERVWFCPGGNVSRSEWVLQTGLRLDF